MNSENQKPASPQYVDLRDIDAVRIVCGDNCPPLRLGPTDLIDAETRIGLFIAEHIHKEVSGVSNVDKDKQVLDRVLSKFLTKDLPEISEIMGRRKLRFEFEIKPKGR